MAIWVFYCPMNSRKPGKIVVKVAVNHCACGEAIEARLKYCTNCLKKLPKQEREQYERQIKTEETKLIEAYKEQRKSKIYSPEATAKYNRLRNKRRRRR